MILTDEPEINGLLRFSVCELQANSQTKDIALDIRSPFTVVLSIRASHIIIPSDKTP